MSDAKAPFNILTEILASDYNKYRNDNQFYFINKLTTSHTMDIILFACTISTAYLCAHLVADYSDGIMRI